MALTQTGAVWNPKFIRGHSCSHCESIVVDLTRENRLIGTNSNRAYRYYRHYSARSLGVSLEDMRKASLARCDFAKFVLGRDSGEAGGLELPEGRSPDDVKLHFDWEPDAELGYVKFTWALPRKHTYNSSAEVPTLDSLDCDSARCLMTPYQGDPPAAYNKDYRPIAVDPLSQETALSVRKWIKECSQTQNHALCSLSGSPHLPSRLVEVQLDNSTSSFRLKLICGKDLAPDSEYVALSYCWGRDAKGILTQKVSESYKTDIPWEPLPKTLQDAAVATHRLEIPFLWVDSLCIIQDDDEDKAKEIGQMTQVFSRATLTIMARRATQASQGFLHERTPPSGMITLPFRCDGTMGWATLYTHGKYTSYGADGEDRGDDADQKSNIFWRYGESTLDKRGWVLQEHILSRRTLEIGTLVTEWSCRQERSLVHYSDGWTVSDTAYRWGIPGKPSAKLQDSEVLDAIMFSSANPGHQDQRLSIQQILDTWKSLVEGYTDRSLSDPTDRILAISGIAERFASSSPSDLRYAAGLWEEDLPDSLLWCLDSDVEIPSEPDKYQRPSWSWTAVDVPIFFWLGGYDLGSRIISVDCVPLCPAAPFGALKSGTLRISGPALNIEVLCEPKSLEPWSEQCVEWRYADVDRRYTDRTIDKFRDDECGLMVYLDAYDQVYSLGWTPITLLAIGLNFVAARNTSDDRQIEHKYGLILRQTAEGNHRRVGLFLLMVDSRESSSVDWTEMEFSIV